MTIVSTKQEGWQTYGELLFKDEDDKFKLRKEEDLPYIYNWLEYLQIKDLYIKNKKGNGFRMELTDLEKILLESEDKQISKLY